MSIVRRLHVGPWLGAAMLTGVWLGCARSDSGETATQRQPMTGQETVLPTPAPTFGGPVDSATNQDLQGYIGALHFVTDPEAGDRQALLVGSYPDSAQYGPIARIEPEKGNFKIPPSQLATGTIIARIINEGTQPYPKLGLLPRGTTYVWVEVDSATGQGRSVFVELDSTGGVSSVHPARLTTNQNHPDFRAVQALAKFVWTNQDEEAWSVCGAKCCKSVD